MAKIDAHKIVSPGVGSAVTPQVASVRKATYAINRLGLTIASVGRVTKDIESIEVARVKNDKLREKLERQKAQREADEAAETAAEINKLGKKGGLKVGKLTNLGKKGGIAGALRKMMPAWLQLLEPVFMWIAKLVAFPVIREMLKWWSDPANTEKIDTFFMKANVIWTKLSNFSNWLFKEKLEGGWKKLTGKESTILERASGLWDLTQGLLVLGALTNPITLITQVIKWIGNFINFFRKKPKPTFKGDKNKSKSSSNQQRTKSKGSSKGIKGKSSFTKGKFTSTKFRAPSIQGSSNILKKGSWWKKAWSGTKNWFKKGITHAKKNPLSTGKSVLKKGAVSAGTLGLGILADWTINAAADKFILKPIESVVNKHVDNKTEEAIAKHGEEAVLKKLETDLKKEQDKKPLAGWKNALTLGYGSIFFGTNDAKVKSLTDRINYIKNRSGEYSNTPVVEVHKPKTEKKKNKWSWSSLFSGNKNKKSTTKSTITVPKEENKTKSGKKWWEFWKGNGGKLPEFFFGKIFKGISKAVSGVVNGVTKAVGGVINTVGKVVSNPIVSTALSFVPGVGPIVAGINAVNNLRQGNIMGAITSGIGALGSFANINTVNAISQPRWMQNLRFSKFGQGVANMYHSGANAWAGLTSGFNNFMGSDIGKLGKGIYTGMTGGGWGGALSQVGSMTGLTQPGGLFGEGGFFGQGGRASQFGDFLNKYNLAGIGNMFPGVADFISNSPLGSLPGFSELFSGQFSAMGALGGMAERAGAGGLFNSVMGMYSGTTDAATGIRNIAEELGVGAEVFGILDKGRSLMDRSKQFALEQPDVELIPLVLPIIKGEVTLAAAIKKKLVIAN